MTTPPIQRWAVAWVNGKPKFTDITATTPPGTGIYLCADIDPMLAELREALEIAAEYVVKGAQERNDLRDQLAARDRALAVATPIR